jgi:hypothetical protein
MVEPYVDEWLDKLGQVSDRLNQAADDVRDEKPSFAKVLEGIEEAVGELITKRRQEIDSSSASEEVLDAVEEMGIGSK